MADRLSQDTFCSISDDSTQNAVEGDSGSPFVVQGTPCSVHFFLTVLCADKAVVFLPLCLVHLACLHTTAPCLNYFFRVCACIQIVSMCVCARVITAVKYVI